MQIVSNLHEMSNLVFWEKIRLETIFMKCQIVFSGKKLSIRRLLKCLPRVLRLKESRWFTWVSRFAVYHSKWSSMDTLSGETAVKLFATFLSRGLF